MFTFLIPAFLRKPALAEGLLPRADDDEPVNAVHYRRVFVSDAHIGHPLSRKDLLLDFMDGCTWDKLYLLGDMFDDMLKKHFPISYHGEDVTQVQHYLAVRCAAEGCKVIRFEGNHDPSPAPLPAIPVEAQPYLLDKDTLLTHGHYEEILWRAGDFLNRYRKHPVKRMPLRTMPLRGGAAWLSGVYRRLVRLGQQRGVKTVIHGHLHLPGVRFYGQGEARVNVICLPDWLDHPGGALVEFPDGRRAMVDAQHRVVQVL